MKKSKDTARIMIITIMISVVMVIVLEGDFFLNIRKYIEMVLPFLDGKKDIIVNIFLGILASSLCMWIGEWVTIRVMRKDMKEEIRKTLKDVLDEVMIKEGASTGAYIQASSGALKYRECINHLYKEYDLKDDLEGVIIKKLQSLMILYHGVYQSNKDKENHWKAYNEQVADTYAKWEKMNKKLEELEKKGAKQHMPEAYSIAAHMKDDFGTIVKSMEKDIVDYQEFQNNTIEFNVNLIKDLEKELRRHRAEIIKKNRAR